MACARAASRRSLGGAALADWTSAEAAMRVPRVRAVTSVFMLRLHQWTIERLPAAVGPVPIGERIALVRAAMALSGGVAAVVRGRYLRGSDEGRGGDQGGGEGESGNEGFHFAVSFVTDDRPFGLGSGVAAEGRSVYPLRY